ncbi:MAG: (2Fe-2S)-binding protein [Pirellulaceae bacterium]|jgi:bacterioferritin-associated ferredoxin
MSDDPEVCLCFHVHRRKILNWIRIERPKRAAQLSECYGAGTGCGWCRPYLEKMFNAAQANSDAATAELPDPETYSKNRKQYIREGKGKPPAGDAANHGPT